MNAKDPKVREFLTKVDALCKEYDLNIAHEDTYGAFEIYYGYDPKVAAWLLDAELP